MHEVDTVPKHVQSALISRLKIMSNVDITERRIPQNGRSTVQVSQRAKTACQFAQIYNHAAPVPS